MNAQEQAFRRIRYEVWNVNPLVPPSPHPLRLPKQPHCPEARGFSLPARGTHPTPPPLVLKEAKSSGPVSATSWLCDLERVLSPL